MTPAVSGAHVHRGIGRKVLRVLGGIALLGVVVLLLAFWYANSRSFAERVRHEVIEMLETATGGRVDLAQFSWHPLKLEAELDGLTIHGLEAPSEVPYAHLDKLVVRAKIIALFRAQVGLRLLQAEHPVVHLIVYPDGTTNQPTPKKKTQQSNKPVTDELFDLAVNETQLDNGVLLVNQRALPFNLTAKDLALKVTYQPRPERYLGTLQLKDLTAQRGKAPEVHSALQMNVELARNAMQLDGLHFLSGASRLDASGSLTDFTALHWRMGANGTIDLREVAALAAVEGLGPGEAALMLKGEGSGAAKFDVSGKLNLKDVSYKTPSLLLTGLNASTSLRATQDEVTLPDLKARLRQGGGVDVDAKVLHWLPPSAPAPGVAPPKAAPQVATIRTHIYGIKLQTVFETIAAKKYEDLGFDTEADGDANIAWTGTPADMVAQAKIALSPPHPATPREVPVNGLLDVSYAMRGGRLDARQVELHTPYSFVGASGRASLSPATGPTSLKVDFTTRNLNEFDRALIALGVSSKPKDKQGKTKQGVAAIPIQLHGEAAFHGAVTGSLNAPDVKGHLSATNFATVIDTAAPVPPTPSPATPVSATPPHPPPPSQGTQQTVQWDDLELDAEYSPALISVSNLSLTRGKTAIHAAAQMHATRGRHGKLTFDARSPLTADVRIDNAGVTDILSIAGESLPVTGTINLLVHASGTQNNLNGGGHLSVAGGTIYGEPYKSLNTDLRFAGRNVGLTNLVFAQNGGRLTGDADYDLQAKSFHANVQGTGFELAHIQQLQKSKPQVGGAVTFDLHASGTAESPQVNGKLALANLSVNQQPAGGLTATVRTEGHSIALNTDATLAGAQFHLAGQVDARGDYPMQAKLTFGQLDFAPLMKLADLQGVSGSSQLAGVVTISGPAKLPKKLNGDAEISRFDVKLQGLPVTSRGPIRASLRDGVLKLNQLEITSEDTNLIAGGTADLFGDGGVDLGVHGGINLRLAQSFSSQLTSSGRVDFNFTAQGATKKPDLEGTVKFTDVNLAYQQVPNGISKLNGTLVFNQDRLELHDVAGTTGGGQLLLGGFLIYQQGIYADLTATLKKTRFRYAGLSSSADAAIRVQGTQNSVLVSGNVEIIRFLVGPNVDFAALAGSGAVSPPPDPNAFANKVRLDIHLTSAPQLDFQNSYAQIAGSVDLRIRGTAAQPAVLGRVNITDGKATYNGTTYQLQHGDVFFTNPVKIEPVIDLDATTRIEEYDVTIGLHGTTSKLQPTFRSEPPLPEADVISLLAAGRTQEEASIYSSQQQAAGVNGTTNALLSGALNATVSNRIQKLFGVGSVKIDPTYTGSLGQSSARITVQENIGQTVLLTYATSVNSTSQQLIQAQVNLSPTLSLTAVRDEADVFSLLFKVHKRYR